MRPARLALLLLATALSGCDSAALYDDEVGDLVLSATDGGFLLQTEGEYACSNYPLVVDAEVNRRSAKIEVEGVGATDVCQPAPGPAGTEVPFADGMSFSEYEIVIDKGGRTDRFVYGCGVGGCVLAAVGEPEFTRVGPR